MIDWEQRWRDLAKRHREVVLQSEALVARLAEVEQALDVERNYWQTRSHLARTRTEEVMAEWHLDLIDAALTRAEHDADIAPTSGDDVSTPPTEVWCLMAPDDASVVATRIVPSGGGWVWMPGERLFRATVTEWTEVTR